MLRFWVWRARSRAEELRKRFSTWADSLDKELAEVGSNVGVYALSDLLTQGESFASSNGELTALHKEYRGYFTTPVKDPNYARAKNRLRSLSNLIHEEIQKRDNPAYF